MNKKHIIAAVFAALALAIVPAAASSAETEISIATILPAQSPIPTGLVHMSETLNRTGNFKTAVYPGSQLGNLIDVIDRVMDGDPVVTICGPDDMADITNKDLYITQALFLLKSWDDFDTLYASDWWKNLVERVTETGIKILAYNWTIGARHILTKEPITKLSDLKGLKIRIPNNTSYVRAFAALDTAPTPIPQAEVFTSLQQGIIDGLENPYSDVYNNRWHEVVKYMIEDVHQRTVALIITGTEFFNSLTPEQQKQLVDAAVDAGNFQRELYEKVDAEYKQKLIDDGVVMTKLENIEEFEKASEKYFESPEFSSWTPGLRETVLGILGRE